MYTHSKCTYAEENESLPTRPKERREEEQRERERERKDAVFSGKKNLKNKIYHLRCFYARIPNACEIISQLSRRLSARQKEENAYDGELQRGLVSAKGYPNDNISRETSSR